MHRSVLGRGAQVEGVPRCRGSKPPATPLSCVDARGRGGGEGSEDVRSAQSSMRPSRQCGGPARTRSRAGRPSPAWRVFDRSPAGVNAFVLEFAAQLFVLCPELVALLMDALLFTSGSMA